ncbi:MAG TPA: pyrroloquinoline quinone biosynthesis protein PqqE [Bryobacteraceae bacterium]|nr:pyrroloquinoline quinone biosynthesis protein PqqE [Bryobacteraceae bacterium]
MMASGPLSLIAEITHRCPLHCVYCSNPLEMQARQCELPTEIWANVFASAAQLGILQLHLTGGEPLARPDLSELIATARKASLYTNLITSGVGLSEERLAALVEAGLDHIQLSFQDSQEAAANEIAGTRAHALKIELARLIKRQRLAFTMNLVVHRQNLDRLPEMIALAEELAADRLEIAHVQYYGWALRNRDSLLPTRSQWERSLEIITAARKRLEGRMRVDFVGPDYYAKYPKACMGGWGRSVILIDPAGRALPCHAAGVIPGLLFDNVQDRDLRWIWEQSPAFRKFRGEDWMPEPCRSCDRRTQDFGGCRCQAMLLTGDAAATDPVCTLSPMHGVVESITSSFHEVPTARPDWVYRIDPVSAVR